MIRLIIALLYISIASQSALAQGVHKYIFSGSYIKDGHINFWLPVTTATWVYLLGTAKKPFDISPSKGK